MESLASPERPRKRRAINACNPCRTSKVRCDGKQPCQRCSRNDTPCLYFDAVKDATVLRIERLETEVSALKIELDDVARRNPGAVDDSPLSDPSGGPLVIRAEHSTSASTVPTFRRNPASLSSLPIGHSPGHVITEKLAACSAVEKGLITWEQASIWFHSFFSGSHYLVPIFCEQIDTFESVSSHSAFLFDAIVAIGCRAEEGFTSSMHHRLQSRLREHLTHLLIDTSTPSVEMVQAITVMASYSENGLILIALALRFALQLGLPDAVDQLMANTSKCADNVTMDEKELYRLARIWHGICNLELFFSLDSGKVPGISLRTSSRRIHALVNHPERTAVDVRLLSQIELNIIRSNTYATLLNQSSASILPDNETSLRSTVQETLIELSLWREEWVAIVSSATEEHQRSLALLNIHIQYNWALITLHLKALSVSGIENIALMSDFQRDMVRTAKEAANQHLKHLLDASSSPSSPIAFPNQNKPPAYLSQFKWAMDYVWAKCACSVLLVLKLALLLRDPLPSVMCLLRDAHKVLEELKKVTVGHIAYFQILQMSIEKCESALREHMTQQPNANMGSLDDDRPAEDDFQGYAPSEFVFEWDFPGLNLRYMPLSWHDVFIDFDSVF